VDGVTGWADQPRHRSVRAAAELPRKVIRQAYLHRACGWYCQEHAP
jgi:hypothetical protein